MRREIKECYQKISRRKRRKIDEQKKCCFAMDVIQVLSNFIEKNHKFF